jgi:peptidoglycan/LPS O-acetylase OafA/YrhL
MDKSADGRWHALDQIRAVAAFLVFVWHFSHWSDGTPVPFEGAPNLPLAALLDEGHTGVALFMCLSGYLFAKLLDGKAIRYRTFLEARATRLLPLLLFVFATNLMLASFKGEPLTPLLRGMVSGMVLPNWPNGGWSILTEIHFYLILPLLLSMRKRNPLVLPLIVGGAIVLRLGVFGLHGSVQTLAYGTIFGRIDQFVLGILAYDQRRQIAANPALPVIALAAIGAFYYAFDFAGGLYQLQGHPSASPIWIMIPTVEALCYSTLIAWYDQSGIASAETAPGKAMLVLGKYSYGIYLLHFYFVHRLATFIDERVMDISNFYLAALWAIPAFAAMLMPAILTNRLIERPFQSRKRRYLVQPAPA